MKKTFGLGKKVFLLMLMICLLLLGCNKVCEHLDDDLDEVCDKCGESLKKECTSHIDEDKDGLCDYCGAELEVQKEEEFNFDAEVYNAEFEKRKSYLREYMTSSKNNTGSSKTGFGISALKIAIYEETKDETMLENALAQADKCYDDFARNQNCFSVFLRRLLLRQYSQQNF